MASHISNYGAGISARKTGSSNHIHTRQLFISVLYRIREGRGPRAVRQTPNSSPGGFDLKTEKDAAWLRDTSQQTGRPKEEEAAKLFPITGPFSS